MNLRKWWNMIALLALTAALVAGCKWPGSDAGSSTTPKPIPSVSMDPTKPDIVVIGSEVEGMYLARAARDEGKSVLVLDPREKPGGQLIQGQMIFLDEPQDDSGKSLVQGRVKLLFDDFKSGKIRKPAEYQAYFNKLMEGIPIESGIKLTDIQIDTSGGSKKRIGQLKYKTKDGQEKTVHAGYYVENSDFAALTSRLGLPRIPGIETALGLPKPDRMASTIMMMFKNVDWDAFKDGVYKLGKREIVEHYGDTTTVTNATTWGFGNVGSRYTPSDPELFLRGLNTINLKDGQAAINALLIYNVDPSNEASVKSAIERGRRETDLVLQHLRKELPGWEKAEVNGYPEYLYVRDYDRFETEYVLQASDIMSGKMFEDNVAIAGYPIDLQGTLTHRWGYKKGDPDKYGIPLRSFIPKGYANIITAGKNVGATGAAYGSARIQPNTSLAGEVIGLILSQLDSKTGITEMTPEQFRTIRTYIETNYRIKLTGPDGANKVKNWTPAQLEQLNYGTGKVD
ncbi:FAD-dependent oxidoreductase [Paenibacillus koleovorans]|uniref:FAD-dependent oxidoreductase n=1 Tax=Paenibacillus koleovorans TaxID=121608 RepID=UPI000FDAF212|nr:FAD-dependent oxidoreductase [Paenibacillus koleovorans]